MQLQTVGRSILAAVCLMALMSATGCSRKMYGAVQFESNPPGAEVINLKDDATLGQTPVVVTWESSDGEPEYVTIEMKKTGYLEEITSMWVNKRHESREEAKAEAQPLLIDLKQRK